jgi:Domain of unknown function (DUF4440)
VGRIRLVGLVLVSFQILAGQTSRPATSDKQVLTQLENDWGDAVSKGDPSKLEKVIADDWTGRYPFYVLNKALELELIKSGDIKVQNVSTSDFKVRVFGDVAVVTGADDEKGSYYKGRDVSGHYLWMDVFLKRSGRWQCVASEETLDMTK